MLGESDTGKETLSFSVDVNHEWFLLDLPVFFTWVSTRVKLFESVKFFGSSLLFTGHIRSTEDEMTKKKLLIKTDNTLYVSLFTFAVIIFLDEGIFIL